MSKIATTDAKSTEPVVELAPPKDDIITPQELAGFDGTDASKPIYVAIKGMPFAYFDFPAFPLLYFHTQD